MQCCGAGAVKYLRSSALNYIRKGNININIKKNELKKILNSVNLIGLSVLFVLSIQIKTIVMSDRRNRLKSDLINAMLFLRKNATGVYIFLIFYIPPINFSLFDPSRCIFRALFFPNFP